MSGQDAGQDLSWALADPGHEPPEIDTSKPSVARVYDAILGRKDCQMQTPGMKKPQVTRPGVSG
jgi:hypothetical protein